MRFPAPLMLLACATMLGCASSGSNPPAPPTPRMDRNLIAVDQIQTSRAANAFELVRELRPHWLQKRGSNSMSNDGDVLIYVNGSRFGGPASLRDLALSSITAIRFYDPGMATYRFGGGHDHGVIEVITQATLRGR